MLDQPFQAIAEFRHAVELVRLQHFDGEERNESDGGADAQGDFAGAGVQLIVIKSIRLIPQATAA